MVSCEQAAEIDRCGGLPALARTAVGSRGAGQVTLLLEQYPEVRCGRRLAALVGATKSDRGGRELTPFHK